MNEVHSRNWPAAIEETLEPPLAFSYLRGRGSTLVISISGVGKKRAEQPPLEFFKMASQAGDCHALFVSDASRSWLNGPGVADRIVAEIETTAARVKAKRIVAVGNSMGGTMALFLARLTRIDTVLAIVPQFSAHPDCVPEETRWKFFRTKIVDWPFKAVDTLPVECAETIILHGGTADERIHLNRFPRDHKVKHFVFPEMGHRLAFLLHRQGKLDPIIKHVIAGKPRKMRRAVKNAAGISRNDFEAVPPLE